MKTFTSYNNFLVVKTYSYRQPSPCQTHFSSTIPAPPCIPSLFGWFSVRLTKRNLAVCPCAVVSSAALRGVAEEHTGPYLAGVGSIAVAEREGGDVQM